MKFNKILKDKGLKATPQRLLILDIISKSGHIDIEEIYNKIKEIIPSISIATIYKNLKILVDANIVKEVHIKSFKTLYEVNTNPHIHFVCKNCKTIYDVDMNKRDVISYFKNMLKKNIEDIEINLYSKCYKCEKEI